MAQTMSLPHFSLADHPPADTIKMITGLLERITKTNDRLHASMTNERRSAYTCFHARSIPSIDIHAYLTRILKYCPCSNECFLSLLVYFDRMSRNSSGLRIDSFNIHRLVISGIMVASKFFSDVFFTNTRYAKVGGLPVAELNALELEFLVLNEYNLNVPVEELQQYGDQLLLHWVREEERRKDVLWQRRFSGEQLARSLSSGSNSSSCSSDNGKGNPDDRRHHHQHNYHRHSSNATPAVDPYQKYNTDKYNTTTTHGTTSSSSNKHHSTTHHPHVIRSSSSTSSHHHPQKHEAYPSHYPIEHHHRLPTPPYSVVHH
ncbi:cyclin-domain-containing protein [Syncephalastrum racemosum]|uniref:Cyclin-domain-containing protein n=1 Tax=Syncephalastrum racemosum TaxID=13706 RepID=A0A1X2HWJ1_SYNRA|nr:cyclin-domain-containing protein [Syncephalastrum racemosum]